MKQISRRAFTRTTFAATAGTAFSRMRIHGANDRINLGVIGAGDRGMQILPIFLKQPDVAPVAVCDVYKPYLERGAAACGGKVATHEDFRRLLEIKEIDAVIVATPDHWHALPTILACQSGKDVYCEKPLSLTVVEGRRMVEAARNHNRIVQTGSQQRSGPHYQQAVKLIREGAIGAVHKISAGYTRNAMPGFKPEEILPKELPNRAQLGDVAGPCSLCSI